jgi:uncharacterized membrane protein (DUF485 family)
MVAKKGTSASYAPKISNEMVLNLEIEKSKLNREKSLLLLNKALMMYFAFIIIGVVGFINGFLDTRYLNILIVLGFGVLGVGLVPYMITMSKEEKKLNELILSFTKSSKKGKNSAKKRKP